MSTVESSSAAQHLFYTFMDRFNTVCKKHSRHGEVKLLPVSKGQPVEKLNTFLSLPDFPKSLGENYLDELKEKSGAIKDCDWNYLGALQSRKLSEIIGISNVLQTVSREKEIDFIGKSPKAVSYFIQINISGELQKLGASFDHAKNLLEFAVKNSAIDRCSGFMGIASDLSKSNEVEVAKQFGDLRKFRDQYFPHGKLSMGMSDDFEIAISEGSDLVRVGSLIFGERTS